MNLTKIATQTTNPTTTQSQSDLSILHLSKINNNNLGKQPFIAAPDLSIA